MAQKSVLAAMPSMPRETAGAAGLDSSCSACTGGNRHAVLIEFGHFPALLEHLDVLDHLPALALAELAGVEAMRPLPQVRVWYILPSGRSDLSL